MAYRNKNIYSDNWLRAEVIYLHSLWNQGSSHPSSTRKLIKDRKHHFKRKKAVVSEKEWPCDPSPDPNHRDFTSWPEPLPKPAPLLLSGEELAAALAARAQKNGVEECQRFFNIDADSAGELAEEDVEEEEEVEERAFEFFMEIFTTNNELRRYYEENGEKGEFLCLVCEGGGIKKGRRYGDCVGLVQHCSNVGKIGRRAAHRGLARVLCRVVGWNFEKLPMLVLDLEETLGQMLARDASRMQEKSEEAEQIHNEAVE